MKTPAAIVLILVIIIGIGALAVSQKHKTDQAQASRPAAVSSKPSSDAQANTASAADTITYTNNGFEPAELSVKVGSQVTIKNMSSEPLQFDSDPHPQHTDDPELNIGFVPAGQSVTFKVTATGRHGYHNHLIAGDTGTLIVE